MLQKFVAATLLAAAVLGGVSTASAQDSGVRYRDLDLATAEGAAAFHSRVAAAARRTCEQDGLATGTHISETRQCMNRFRSEILSQLPEAARQQLSASQNAGAVVAAR